MKYKQTMCNAYSQLFEVVAITSDAALVNVNAVRKADAVRFKDVTALTAVVYSDHTAVLPVLFVTTKLVEGINVVVTAAAAAALVSDTEFVGAIKAFFTAAAVYKIATANCFVSVSAAAISFSLEICSFCQQQPTALIFFV